MNSCYTISKDDEFEPNEIKSRLSYRKLRNQVKDELAKLYYGKKVKMSKLVKKYKVSFSTLTDILKKYDENGERLEGGLQKEKIKEFKNQQDDSRTQQALVKIESVQNGQNDHLILRQQAEYTPEYIFYPIDILNGNI